MHFLHLLLLAPAVAIARPWPSVYNLNPRAPQDEVAPPEEAPVEEAPAEEAPVEEAPAETTGRIIPVMVGGQQDVFVPNVVTAAVGDVVQFQFSLGNHTATQSAADSACVPLEGGVHSGHIPYEAGQETVGTFEMPVTTTDTMFMYCATGPHCQLGQVLVINPTDDNQVIDYADLAAAAPENIDGDEVRGGTVGEIPLADAIFDAPPAEEEEAGGAAPPAEAETPAEETATPVTGGAGSIIIIPLGNVGASVPVVNVADGSLSPSTVTVTISAAAASEAPAA